MRKAQYTIARILGFADVFSALEDATAAVNAAATALRQERNGARKVLREVRDAAGCIATESTRIRAIIDYRPPFKIIDNGVKLCNVTDVSGKIYAEGITRKTAEEITGEINRERAWEWEA